MSLRRKVSGKACKETATLLGCSPGTVGSQLHWALARLREIAPELDERHLIEESLT